MLNVQDRNLGCLEFLEFNGNLAQSMTWERAVKIYYYSDCLVLLEVLENKHSEVQILTFIHSLITYACNGWKV